MHKMVLHILYVVHLSVSVISLSSKESSQDFTSCVSCDIVGNQHSCNIQNYHSSKNTNSWRLRRKKRVEWIFGTKSYCDERNQEKIARPLLSYALIGL